MCFNQVEWEGTSNGITKMWRYVPPAHYTLRVDSFSLFISNKIDSYESCMFDSGGFKWKLSVYPNGNTKRKVKDQISLYLAIANTDDLPSGWEVNVTFKFFLYNHICDKYLTFQDAVKATTRLFPMKTEVGFDEWFPLATLNDLSNGFLLEDGCIFGAEVFDIKFDGRRECISIIKHPPDNTFKWKIPNFSEITEEQIYSDKFVVGEHKWKLILYPKGSGKEGGESISLFLELVDDLPFDRTVFAEFKLCFKNHITEDHQEWKAKRWFSGSSKDWGWSKFLSQKDFKNKSKVYLVDGTLTVEAQIILVSTHKDF